MRRADRLFQIVQYLRGRRLTTAAQLAERLEVSERTIYRDIADLQKNGVPIDGEAGIGYIMREGHDLPPLMFTREEIVALVTGARMAKAWGGSSMARAAEEALFKIEAVLPEKDRDRVQATPIFAPSFEYGFQMSPEVRECLDVFERATETGHIVRFDYLDGEGNATEREVKPLGLLFWGQKWTVAAWCCLREDFRTFRLDRINALRLGEIARPQKGQTLLDFYRLMEARDRDKGFGKTNL